MNSKLLAVDSCSVEEETDNFKGKMGLYRFCIAATFCLIVREGLQRIEK